MTRAIRIRIGFEGDK